MEVVKASLLCEVDEELINEETANCLVHRILVCRAATRQFWRPVQRQANIKVGLFIVVAVLYIVYFAYAMYYYFGDEASIRLLWVTCVVFVVMVIKAANHFVRKRFSKTSRPRLITLLPHHSSLISW